MATVRIIPGAIRQIWQPEPERATFEVRVDEDLHVMSLELPSGTRVALDYTAICDMVKAIEARKK